MVCGWTMDSASGPAAQERMVLEATLIGPLIEVLLVNLVLSGDNAVVIGLAARGLAPRQRNRAILLGGGLAVLMRLALTIPAAYLLHVPLLRAGGGILLLWVAYRLLVDEEEERNHGESTGIATAIRLILIADLTMSLDNILAVAAVAERSTRPLLVLIVGLALSIPIVLAGGNVVARLMGRLPLLAWVGAAILAFTAGGLIVEDVVVVRTIDPSTVWKAAFEVALTVGLVAFAWWRTRPRQLPVAD